VRILVVQRSLSPPGGGNAVAAWMIHALAAQHDVNTITASAWSEAETNAFYGTAIPEGVTQHVVPAPWRWLSNLPEDRLTRLRMCSVLRYARPLTAAHDLLITADNFAAFAKPGIQYVHFPAALQPRPAHWPPVVNAYFSFCDALAGARWTGAATNLTLANSRWTASGLERLGEVPTPTVLYPPVLDPGSGLPWPDREDTFLCVGRFHGSKRIETAMSIVAKVRAAAVPQARLIVVGSAVDREYTTRMHRLAATHGGWIEFRDDLSRVDLNRLMARSRYGIQAMANEHFGMATAEMTRAGCLVFAHNSGGSPEVLNNEPALLWNDDEEAVRKICDLARRTGEDLHRQRSTLRLHAERFSTDTFQTRIREIVDGLR
jgi:glycosyltransferase involved in cell wall biosynthesis